MINHDKFNIAWYMGQYGVNIVDLDELVWIEKFWVFDEFISLGTSFFLI